MKYISAELHCHTYHSDGKLSVSELLAYLKSLNIECFSITDHNTLSAYQDLNSDELGEKTVLKGIEWTTFFGHVLVLGCNKIVDWRFATPDNIDEYISEIKNNGGIVGIAHPYQVGSPMCTGCYFDFKVKNWSNVNYIEVWSRETPTNTIKNHRAIKLWYDKLNEGNKISAVSGRDLHEIEEKLSFATTYLGVNEATPQGMKEAIENGRIYVTLGPKLSFNICTQDKVINLGDSISSQNINAQFNIDLDSNNAIWSEFGIAPKSIRVVNNAEVIYEVELINNKADVNITPKKGWVLFEVWGEYMGDEDKRVLFTNPIYIY